MAEERRWPSAITRANATASGSNQPALLARPDGWGWVEMAADYSANSNVITAYTATGAVDWTLTLPSTLRNPGFPLKEIDDVSGGTAGPTNFVTVVRGTGSGTLTWSGGSQSYAGNTLTWSGGSQSYGSGQGLLIRVNQDGAITAVWAAGSGEDINLFDVNKNSKALVEIFSSTTSRLFYTVDMLIGHGSTITSGTRTTPSPASSYASAGVAITNNDVCIYVESSTATSPTGWTAYVDTGGGVSFSGASVAIGSSSIEYGQVMTLHSGNNAYFAMDDGAGTVEFHQLTSTYTVDTNVLSFNPSGAGMGTDYMVVPVGYAGLIGISYQFTASHTIDSGAGYSATISGARSAGVAFVTWLISDPFGLLSEVYVTYTVNGTLAGHAASVSIFTGRIQQAVIGTSSATFQVEYLSSGSALSGAKGWMMVKRATVGPGVGWSVGSVRIG